MFLAIGAPTCELVGIVSYRAPWSNYNIPMAACGGVMAGYTSQDGPKTPPVKNDLGPIKITAFFPLSETSIRVTIFSKPQAQII